MQLSLQVLCGGYEGDEISIEYPAFCIGRDAACELRAQSLAVSRRHAAILVRDGKVVVCDLGSRNGTFVNEVPVTGERELRHNDRLRVGPLEFRFRARPAALPEPGHPSSTSSAGAPAWGLPNCNDLLNKYPRPMPF